MSNVLPDIGTPTGSETERSSEAGFSMEVIHKAGHQDYLGIKSLSTTIQSSTGLLDTLTIDSRYSETHRESPEMIEEEEDPIELMHHLRKVSVSTRSPMTDEEEGSPADSPKIKKIATIQELVREETETLNFRCRICFEEGDFKDLIQPCKCSGSLKYIHKACLKQWLSGLTGNLELAECEICKTKLNVKVEKEGRRTCVCSHKTFSEFIYSPQIVVLLILATLTGFMFALSFLITNSKGSLLIVMQVTTFFAAAAVCGIFCAHVFTTFVKTKVKRNIILHDRDSETKSDEERVKAVTEAV